MEATQSKTIMILSPGVLMGVLIKFDEKTRSLALSELHRRLTEVADEFNPDGFILLQCVMLDSSRLGEMTILPVGGRATLKSIPDHPISPRGLASDMSEVVGFTPIEDFRKWQPVEEK